jgi:hypothetical protein
MIPLADPFCRAWFRYQSNTQIDFCYDGVTVLHFCGSSGLSGAQFTLNAAVNGENGRVPPEVMAKSESLSLSPNALKRRARATLAGDSHAPDWYWYRGSDIVRSIMRNGTNSARHLASRLHLGGFAGGRAGGGGFCEGAIPKHDELTGVRQIFLIPGE